jgi:hypothetical protein
MATADGVGRFSRRAPLAFLGVVTAASAAIAVAGAVIARGSAQCLLVIIGATPEGKKEVVGLIDGVRTVRWRIVANALSMTFVVRRCFQCSAGKS